MNLSQKLIKDCKKLKKLNLILSGGNSPLKDYKNLFKAKLNWKDIDLYLSDERLVKINNKQSNFFNINKILKENNLEKKLKPINKIFLQKKKIMKILNNIKKKNRLLQFWVWGKMVILDQFFLNQKNINY